MSVFTHSRNHEAFTQVREEYLDSIARGAAPDGDDKGESESRGEEFVEFFMDRDRHEADKEGHYLHLAEAFRWILEKDQDYSLLRRVNEERGDAVPSMKQRGAAEWIMLVEDDFPVCGEAGWKVVETVLSVLEDTRVKSGGKDVKSGFVGTGGR